MKGIAKRACKASKHAQTVLDFNAIQNIFVVIFICFDKFKESSTIFTRNRFFNIRGLKC